MPFYKLDPTQKSGVAEVPPHSAESTKAALSYVYGGEVLEQRIVNHTNGLHSTITLKFMGVGYSLFQVDILFSHSSITVPNSCSYKAGCDYTEAVVYFHDMVEAVTEELLVLAISEDSHNEV